MDDPLFSHSATRLAVAIASRARSSVEIVEACLARLEEVNPRINAVVRLSGDALERARAADAAVARGDPLGPLHGVPFTIQDSLDTAGVVTTAGTAGWRARVPERDATVVARLRVAGGILLGKTNTPEFTWANETANDVYGRTSNPYDLGRTPGGSSGGSAAAVAAGLSPFDIGSDSGNSIRHPAHLCGSTRPSSRFRARSVGSSSLRHRAASIRQRRIRSVSAAVLDRCRGSGWSRNASLRTTAGGGPLGLPARSGLAPCADGHSTWKPGNLEGVKAHAERLHAGARTAAQPKPR